MPSPHVPLEVYLTAADDDLPQAQALAEALGRRARWAVRTGVAPGESAQVESARAIEEAGLFVVLLSRGSPLDGGLREEVAAMTARVRRDPLRKIVPLYLDEAAKRDPGAVYGLGAIQGVAIEGGDLGAAAEVVAETVRGLRGGWERKAVLAVVAVAAELGEVRAAVARRFRGMTGVAEVLEIDAASGDAVERARAANLVIVLVEGRTGGTKAMDTLLAEGARGLKSSKVDMDLVPEEELAAAQALRRKIPASFATPAEAERQALEHFEVWLKSWAPRGKGKGALLESWERAYLEVRLDKWEHGAHGPLAARAGRRQLDRARLYVPLRARPGEVWIDEEGRLLAGAPDAPNEPTLEMDPLLRGREKPQVAPYLEKIASHPELPHLVFEGEAGAGKTVLLQHIAYVLACRHLLKSPPASELDPGGLEVGAPLLRIPILIEAKRIAECAHSGDPGELTTLLAAELRQATATATIDERAIADGLAAGRYLLLIDSLDEVPSLEGRERVVACLAKLVTQRWPIRIILTTRPMAHTGVRIVDRGLRLVRIAALDGETIRRMAERWATAMGEDAHYQSELHNAISNVSSRHPAEGEGSLVANPLLLTCMMLVYDQQRLLPDSPAQLFDEMIAILCKGRPSPDLPWEVKREALERAFTSIQEAGGTTRPVPEVAEALLRWRPDLQTLGGATELLDRLAAETGVLRFETTQGPRGQSVQIARPWHRSFQQFLVARGMAFAAASVTAGTDKLFVAENGNRAIIDDPAWEGALGFLVGVYAQRGKEAAKAYVTRLREQAMEPAGKARRGRLLGLAAQGLAEYPDVLAGDPLRNELRDAVATSFAAEGVDWPLGDRLLALEALGRLGDPRLEGDPWVLIEGGPFTIGDGRPTNAVPPRKEVVASFRLFSRPVTVQDYAAFVTAGGYEDETWWEAGREEDRAEPVGWAEQRFHPTRPVMGVSWYEAKAFCRWASHTWNLAVDLPTEVEWEYAASGSESRPFPWGKEDPGKGDEARANYRWDGDGVGHVTPVGAFPRGVRAGLLDLAGNVWEWCEDPWTEERQAASVETESLRGAPRVFRGGSYRNGSRGLRCACRDRYVPGAWGFNLGFRVVCRGPHQP